MMSHLIYTLSKRTDANLQQYNDATKMVLIALKSAESTTHELAMIASYFVAF